MYYFTYKLGILISVIIMHVDFIYYPSAKISNIIEEIGVIGKNNKRYSIRLTCDVISRLISATVFPIFLLLEMAFKRVPKLLFSIVRVKKIEKKFDKVVKFALGILCSPIGLYSPHAVPSLFLKQNFKNYIAPFGVEDLFGKKVDKVLCPKSLEELKQIVKTAKEGKKQISIIGAGMSQGTQTIPQRDDAIVIDLKNFQKMQLSSDQTLLDVQAGATWEEVQIYLNNRGKSILVKQASDIFTIGGSIAINCHGWQHECGSIASTIEELQVINSDGELEIVKKDQEKFGNYIGTLGYFGIIVSAKLKVTNNIHMVEETIEIPVKDFHRYYLDELKGKNIPLLGGRLVLDSLESNPLNGNVCIVTYKEDKSCSIENSQTVITPNFQKESKLGTRIERIGLQLFANLPNYFVKHFTSWFWNREKKAMLKGRKITRNEALHPPINAFKTLHHSKLNAQWLQEYFIKGENLADFLAYLGAELKSENVRIVNATIRPTPKDEISILPYAEQDRYGVVICFAQEKSNKAIEKTKTWIQRINRFIINHHDIYYQAYMPFSTREEFIECYGQERIEKLLKQKQLCDPNHIFGNAHTSKYYDLPIA